MPINPSQDAAAARFRFLAEFANTDLERADWPRLQRGLHEFVQPVIDSHEPILMVMGDLSEEMVRNLQKKVSVFLDGVVRDRGIRAESEGRRGGSIDAFEVTVNIGVLANPVKPVRKRRRGDLRLFVSGDLSNLFVYYAVSLIGSRPSEQFRRCPECGRVFYRVRRQKHCSERCSGRAYMRSYRQGKAVKERRSDVNHRAYANRMKPARARRRRKTAP